MHNVIEHTRLRSWLGTSLTVAKLHLACKHSDRLQTFINHIVMTNRAGKQMRRPEPTRLEVIPVRGAQLVSTAARVLRALAGASTEGWRIADLVERTGLERSAVTRIVGALCLEGLAMKTASDRRYALGPLALELGLSAAQRFPLAAAADASMRRLAERTHDTCFLMIRSGEDAVCVDRREGTYPVKALTIEIGDRRPLGVAAASLALLMHMPTHECERYLSAHADRIARYGMLTADVVRRMLARSRKLGYALNHDNILPHVSAVGVAIPPRLGIPYAALSVSALTTRMMEADRRMTIVRWLQEESRVIAAQL